MFSTKMLAFRQRQVDPFPPQIGLEPAFKRLVSLMQYRYSIILLDAGLTGGYNGGETNERSTFQPRNAFWGRLSNDGTRAARPTIRRARRAYFAKATKAKLPAPLRTES